MLEGVQQAAAAEMPELGARISCSISASLATFPENGHAGDELLAVADSAMYRAKQADRNMVLPR